MHSTIDFREVLEFFQNHGWTLEEIVNDVAKFARSGGSRFWIEVQESRVLAHDFETIKDILGQEDAPPPFGFGPRDS